MFGEVTVHHALTSPELNRRPRRAVGRQARRRNGAVLRPRRPLQHTWCDCLLIPGGTTYWQIPGDPDSMMPARLVPPLHFGESRTSQAPAVETGASANKTMPPGTGVTLQPDPIRHLGETVPFRGGYSAAGHQVPAKGHLKVQIVLNWVNTARQKSAPLKLRPTAVDRRVAAARIRARK